MMNPDLWAPPERDMPPGRGTQRRSSLLDELVRLESSGAAAPVASGGRSGRRRRWAALLLIPAALLILGAAGYAIVIRHANDVLSGIGCYAAADLGANTTVAQA